MSLALDRTLRPQVALARLANARASARRVAVARATSFDPPAEALRALDAEVCFEWIGHYASFDARTGDAEPLPSYVVPSAFREWGVEVRDWQSQCSSRVSGTRLYTKDARFVPVVGCEADASTVESREVDFIEINPRDVSEGSYSACYVDQKGMETVTHCVVTRAGTEPRIRVRMKHRADGVGAVRIWREAIDDEFTDGGVLASSCGGCSSVAKFAEGPRDARDVVARVDPDFTLPENAVALPAGIWFTLSVSPDGSYASELGYAHEPSKQHIRSARSRVGADESAAVAAIHRLSAARL